MNTGVLNNQMKFLVIQQKMIGDVLASTVICESLKYHFPNAIVHLVANENTLPVLQNNPFINEIIIFKDEYRSNKKALYRFLKSFRRTEYNAVFDAYGKLESNLISLFAKSKLKIANRKWYSRWIYSETVQQTKTGEQDVPLSISNRLMLLKPLVSAKPHISYPKLYLSEKEIASAKKNVGQIRKKEGQKVIMIGILGSEPQKTYPPAYMAQLLDLIAERTDAFLLFNYIPKQKQEALAIYNLCKTSTQTRIVIDFYARSLRDFMAVLAECDALIGNEGGAANMAKALNVPSFSIFSPFIMKGSWHGNTDQNQMAVHLSDYRPELIDKKKRKELRAESLELYKAFKPEFIEKSLLIFVQKHLD